MTCRLIAVALLLPVSWGSAQEDKKDAAVRVIDIQGLVKGAQRGKVTAPTVIANEDVVKANCGRLKNTRVMTGVDSHVTTGDVFSTSNVNRHVD